MKFKLSMVKRASDLGDIMKAADMFRPLLTCRGETSLQKKINKIMDNGETASDFMFAVWTVCNLIKELEKMPCSVEVEGETFP